MKRLILYSLKSDGDKSRLSIDLTGFVRSISDHSIQIDLPTGRIFLPKWEYVNQMKVYQDPKDQKCFFIVCNKSVSRDDAFNTLMQHAINKLKNRVTSINEMISKLENELAGMEVAA
jgi:hypothetical protein